MFHLIDILNLDPESSIELEYLAEGAANVVYRIRFPPSSPSISSDLELEGNGNTPPPSKTPPLSQDPRLSGKLLRLRKQLPFTVPVIESQEYWEKTICPLFPTQNLVEQFLFKPSASLIKQCNNNLRRMEADGSRAYKRHSVYLVEGENYGTLITDMTCTPTDHQASIEFKPKWLEQSPSAPAGSVRCRTCALRAMKSCIRKPSSRPVENLKLGFCPLSLVSDDREQVCAAVNIVLELCRNEERDDENLRRALVDFLHKSPLLRKLQMLQIEMDSVGVLDADLSQRNFLTAMTIRDCTLFLKVRSLPPLSFSSLPPFRSHLTPFQPKTPQYHKNSFQRNSSILFFLLLIRFPSPARAPSKPALAISTSKHRADRKRNIGEASKGGSLMKDGIRERRGGWMDGRIHVSLQWVVECCVFGGATFWGDKTSLFWVGVCWDRWGV